MWKKILHFHKKVPVEPSSWLWELNFEEYEPPEGLQEFLETLIACIPIMCRLQSILYLKQLKKALVLVAWT